MEHLPWHVVEAPYQPRDNVYWETVLTLGNGYMGARGCLEEGFPALMETYPGAYIAGVFDNFEGPTVELVNVPGFWNASVRVGNETMSMSEGAVSDYSRTLDMRAGLLERRFTWESLRGKRTAFVFQRFLSLDRPHLACLRIQATPLNHSSSVSIRSTLDGTAYNRRQRDWPPLTRIVRNEHLDPVAAARVARDEGVLHVRTKTTRVDIVMAAKLLIAGRAAVRTTAVGVSASAETPPAASAGQIVQEVSFRAKRGETVGMAKFTAVFTSRDAKPGRLRGLAIREASRAARGRWDALVGAHAAAWAERWDRSDIVIGGDPGAQQGIRFNLFQLMAANARNDPGVNLAAKLLSHTRYKGNCFWDTEIFMFPFFVFTDPHAARNLLLYRYRMLPAARRRARDHWMRGAMYPWMSAQSGDEQCESWEYGECEIHITADVAYAFDQYLRATGDEEFFARRAAEVFVETARLWADRVAWSPRRRRYTILSVKGPDEYCSITNNNMFTNYLAARNLELGEEAVARMRSRHPKAWKRLAARIGFNPAEVGTWRDVRKRMYYNWDRDLLIQDDTFLDKEPDDLRKYADRKKPLVEIMPYERIMRVRLLRQTDVVLLMYLLNDRFTRRQKERAYDYYEPMTTHDSSLSYNTHSIMAAELGRAGAAYGYFRKSCRLDLDDELGTARSGIHGASLGGTWQTVVAGFGGMRVREDGTLSFNPILPASWTELAFSVAFRGRTVAVRMTRGSTELALRSGAPLTVLLNGKKVGLD
jgi:trehalose/maltose hydrolase-like predicted phosphorylase